MSTVLGVYTGHDQGACLLRDGQVVALIEEERRLLYVAMTRAKQSLTLVAPLRYHVTQQRRDGDKHVYGARSRFMTDRLLKTMVRAYHGRSGDDQKLAPRTDKRIDVAGAMREMW